MEARESRGKPRTMTREQKVHNASLLKFTKFSIPPERLVYRELELLDLPLFAA